MQYNFQCQNLFQLELSLTFDENQLFQIDVQTKQNKNFIFLI